MDEKQIPEEEVSTAEEKSEDGSTAEEEPKKGGLLVTRRDFLIGSGAGVAVGAVAAAAGMSAVRPESAVVSKETGGMPAEAPAEVAAVDELPATMRRVTLNINGTDYEVTTDVRWSLWEVLVYKLNFGGTKRGCDRAECGACAVAINGMAVNACTVLAARLEGKEILTVEGLASGPRYEDLHPIQRAYIEKGGFQCGICTSGFIMSTYALLEENPNPSEDDIREALGGNICRCSEYPKIYDSVFQAAEWMA